MARQDKSREDRLAEALRANLKRRKAQSRELDQTVAPAKAGASGLKDADEE